MKRLLRWIGLASGSLAGLAIIAYVDVRFRERCMTGVGRFAAFKVCLRKVSVRPQAGIEQCALADPLQTDSSQWAALDELVLSDQTGIEDDSWSICHPDDCFSNLLVFL